MKRGLFFSGVFLVVLSFFFPFLTSAKGALTFFDFSIFSSVGISYLFFPIFTLSVLFYSLKRYKISFSFSIIAFFLSLSVFFMRTQWVSLYKTKYFIDFFKIAGAGWILLTLGTGLSVIAVISMFRDRRRAPYLFIIPMLVGVSFLTFFPAGFAVFVSFQKWNILLPRKPFVGWDNFVKAFTDVYFWNSVWISFKYALIVIPMKLILAYTFALMINAVPKFKGLFRVIYFLPTVTSVVAVSVIWTWIFNSYYGFANYLLSLFGIPAVDWLGNSSTAIWAVAIVSIWRGVGYDIIIFLAGLNGISQAVIEASRIDGATRWQRLRYIITPLMKPSLVFVLITSTIGAIQVFSEIYMMTGGIADTKTAVYYIWEYGFSRLQMGYASAMSLIFFLIILTITLVQTKITKVMKEE
jgi:multiple sugar transport system permease protein